VSTRKARDVIDGSDESHAADRTYSWDRHKTPAYWIVLSEVKKLFVGAVYLLIERIDAGAQASNVRWKAVGTSESRV